MTHICISKLTIIGSDNGLSPVQRQAIIWTNAGILLIKPQGTKFNEILLKMKQFSFRKNVFENVVWKMAAILSRPQCVKSVLSKHMLDWIHECFLYKLLSGECYGTHWFTDSLVPSGNNALPKQKMTQIYVAHNELTNHCSVQDCYEMQRYVFFLKVIQLNNSFSMTIILMMLPVK